MKKILFIGLLLLPLLLQAQGRFPLANSVHVSSGDYPSVLDDGNTEAWFIADSDYITESGGYVSQWDDVSGNDNHLIQATTNNMPQYANDSVWFDGNSTGSVGDWLKSATIADLDQPTSIYAVIKFWSWRSGALVMDGDGTNTLRWEMTGTVPDFNLYAGSFLGVNSDLVVGDFAIVRIVANGSSSKSQINTETAVTGDMGTTDMDGISVARYGGTGSGMSPITIKEMIFRSVDDSASDETAIVNYLNNKYNVY